MMSQNRQSTIDRQDAKHDYEVNMKAELEIELLHDKLAALQEHQLIEILELLQAQQRQLEAIEARLS